MVFAASCKWASRQSMVRFRHRSICFDRRSRWPSSKSVHPVWPRLFLAAEQGDQPVQTVRNRPGVLHGISLHETVAGKTVERRHPVSIFVFSLQIALAGIEQVEDVL